MRKSYYMVVSCLALAAIDLLPLQSNALSYHRSVLEQDAHQISPQEESLSQIDAQFSSINSFQMHQR